MSEQLVRMSLTTLFLIAFSFKRSSWKSADLHFRSGNQRVKKPVVPSDPETYQATHLFDKNISRFMDWIQSALRHNQKEGVKLWVPANASKGDLEGPNRAFIESLSIHLSKNNILSTYDGDHIRWHAMFGHRIESL